MIHQRREAQEGTRSEILEALRQPNDHSIYPEALQYLRRFGFKPSQVVKDLTEYLEKGGRLYLLIGEGIRGTKYQCCLDYDDLIVHVKISPSSRDGRPRLFLNIGFHTHNTGGRSLPP
jgi:hypothetical protein